jgi:hypothetical protein
MNGMLSAFCSFHPTLLKSLTGPHLFESPCVVLYFICKASFQMLLLLICERLLCMAKNKSVVNGGRSFYYCGAQMNTSIQRVVETGVEVRVSVASHGIRDNRLGIISYHNRYQGV